MNALRPNNLKINSYELHTCACGLEWSFQKTHSTTTKLSDLGNNCENYMVKYKICGTKTKKVRTNTHGRIKNRFINDDNLQSILHFCHYQ
jgi:hypothetical protein